MKGIGENHHLKKLGYFKNSVMSRFRSGKCYRPGPAAKAAIKCETLIKFMSQVFILLKDVFLVVIYNKAEK